MNCWGGGAAKTAFSKMTDYSLVTIVNHFYNGYRSLGPDLAPLRGSDTDEFRQDPTKRPFLALILISPLFVAIPLLVARR